MYNIFENQFWFCEVEALHIDELQIQIRRLQVIGYRV